MPVPRFVVDEEGVKRVSGDAVPVGGLSGLGRWGRGGVGRAGPPGFGGGNSTRAALIKRLVRG